MSEILNIYWSSEGITKHAPPAPFKCLRGYTFRQFVSPVGQDQLKRPGWTQQGLGTTGLVKCNVLY